MAIEPSETLRNVQEAERILFDTYLSVIKETYDVADVQKKSMIRDGLERLVYDLEKPLVIDNLIFDKKKAREIRSRLHLTGVQLAEKLGVRADNISHYEHTGIARHPLKQEKPQYKYLLWLKEQGYNPFNLE